MNNKLGFILIEIQKTNNQHKHYIDVLSKSISENPNKNICIFNSFCDSIIPTNMPVLHIKYSKFFEGDIFLFNTTSVLLTNSFPKIKTRYLYMDHAPWINGNAPYEKWEGIFMQENVEIVVPTQELYDIYNICWKKPVMFEGGFNCENIKKLY
jgi:hypothetical protein